MTPQETAIATKPANPAPLGLAAFGLTTVVLSCVNGGLIPLEAAPVVVPLAFAYGGLAQIIAGIMEFKQNNTFGTVAFVSYGCFWWWYALLLWTMGAGWLKPPHATGIGLTLLMWGVFTFCLWIATFRLPKMLWAIFLTLWIAFFLLGAADMGMGVGWRKAGGWDGVLCGCLALYLSFAQVTNAVAGRTAIPVGEPLISN